MAKKELQKSESSQSARLHVFELQVDGGSATSLSRVPSAKSQDTIHSHSSSKIRGLAGLQPVLGKWNVNDREIMNEYLLKRLQAGDDVEADERFRTFSPDLFREYLEEMLKSPKKLEELVSKSLNLQYDKRSVEAELRVLAEEARKAADEMDGKRPAGSKEMRKKDTGSRNGAPDISGSTGVEPGQSPRFVLQGSHKDIYVVGVQVVKPKDPQLDPFALGRSAQTPDLSLASSQKHSGGGRKGDGKGTWSPSSSEYQLHDGDLRGGSPPTPSDRVESGSRTADTSNGRDAAWNPAQESQKETHTSADLVGRGSKQTKGRHTSGKSRKSSGDLKRSVGRRFTSARQSEGQKVTSVKQSEGRKVKSAKQSEGHMVTSDAAADIESDSRDLRGAKRKSRSKKGRWSASHQVQDSVDGDVVPGKSHQIEIPEELKLIEDLPSSQAAGQGEKAVEPSLSVPPPTAEGAGKEGAALKKGSQPRTLKTKSPRTLPVKIAGVKSEEPDSKPIAELSAEPVPQTLEPVTIEQTDAPPEGNETAAEPTPVTPVQAYYRWRIQKMSRVTTPIVVSSVPGAEDEFPPTGPTEPVSHGFQQPLSQQPHSVRQTLRDDIFLGFYFTRAFVFSYFRTKPSHYDPALAGSLLKSDVLDATQRRLLRNLIEDPYRYRCLRDVRALERMQALARTAGRKSMAKSPIARHLHRLPNLLRSA